MKDSDRKKQIEDAYKAFDARMCTPGQDNYEDSFIRIFTEGAEWADANPQTTGDDERDAKEESKKYLWPTLAECYLGIEMFKAGRKGMVPAWELKKAGIVTTEELEKAGVVPAAEVERLKFELSELGAIYRKCHAEYGERVAEAVKAAVAAEKERCYHEVVRLLRVEDKGATLEAILNPPAKESENGR